MWPFDKKEKPKQLREPVWRCSSCKTTREWIDYEWQISNKSDLYLNMCAKCGRKREQREKELTDIAALVAGGMSFERDMRGEFYSASEIAERSFQIAESLLAKKKEISNR